MGKFQALDPKAQAAIGVGGGLLAGALVEHEIHDFRRHHHHIPMGNIGGLAAAAGMGALGAKLLGGRGQTPGAPSGGGGLGSALGGLGGLFVGGGAAAAAQAPPSMQQGWPPQGYPSQPGFPPQAAWSSNVPPPPPPYGKTRDLPDGDRSALGNAALGGLAGVAGATVIGSMMHHSDDPNDVGNGGSQGGLFGGSEGGVGGAGYDSPPLYIEAALFGDRDVTPLVRSLVDVQQKLVIKGGNGMREVLGDPWPEAQYLALTVLFRFGDRPMELKTMR
jgi:hypothetical protein